MQPDGDPVTCWTGWDVPGGMAGGPEADGAFVQSPARGLGADQYYELLAVAGRGFRPPRFLSTVRLSAEDQSGHRVEDADSPGLRETWSLLYRQVAEIGDPAVAPYAIYLLGVDPPAGATDEELDVFNAFYTNVHLPEVAQRRHALRATRHELVREVRPPYRGAPRFLAVYEVDEDAASHRRHAGPPYATGPEVWQRHTTPWRLWYRRLVPGDGAIDR